MNPTPAVMATTTSLMSAQEVLFVHNNLDNKAILLSSILSSLQERIELTYRMRRIKSLLAQAFQDIEQYRVSE